MGMEYPRHKVESETDSFCACLCVELAPSLVCSYSVRPLYLFIPQHSVAVICHPTLCDDSYKYTVMAGHGPDGLVCLLAVLRTMDRDLEVAWHVWLQGQVWC